MTTKIEIPTNEYNSRRYSKPWIARVTFTQTAKALYEWGRWIGTESHGTGSAGALVITAAEGDIIARGRKDYRGGNTSLTFFQVRDGVLVELPGGKVEAYKLASS